MSASELTSEQIEELHQVLLSARARLAELLKLSKEGARPVDLGEPIGRLTRMDAIQQQQMTKASRSAYEMKLRQVKAALELLGKDEYGSCRSCEEPIGYPRLKARPEAPYCLSCQGARESR
jgi:DnaK suppressor protein